MNGCLKILGILFLLFTISCKKPAEERVPELIAKLSHRETSERYHAALELANYGRDAQKAVPDLIRLLRDPNGGVKSAAAYALRTIDTPEAQEALEKASGFKGREKSN